MTVTLNHAAIDRAGLFLGESGLAQLRVTGERVAERAAQLLADRTHTRTGTLLGSIKSELGEDAIGPFAKVSASATVQRPSGEWNYASMMEYGTPGHPITPKDANWLSSDGDPGHPDPLWYPHKSVDHPGTIGLLFLHDARREITGQ
jgi:hypothetical protein